MSCSPISPRPGRSVSLTADRAAELLRRIPPRDAAGKTLRRPGRRPRHRDTPLGPPHHQSRHRHRRPPSPRRGTTLDRTVRYRRPDRRQDPRPVGTISRFRSAAAFATYTGTAPIEYLPATLSATALPRRGPTTQLLPHIMALTQIRLDTPGRTYYLRKRTDGKGHKEAMRCLKRRLSDVVYRQLRQRRRQTEAGPGGHSGAALESSAASSNPAH